MQLIRNLTFVLLAVLSFQLLEAVNAEEPRVEEDSWEEWDAGESWDDESGVDEGAWDISGFAESSFGVFVKSNSTVQSNQSLEEVRGQLSATRYIGEHFLNVKAGLLYDGVLSEWVKEIRELNLTINHWQQLDLKVGRQILTWGTGDLVFLNDLFPKDWQSFFSGREQSYLKAPSDAIRVTYYSDAVNVDSILTPKFDSDRFINGERFSYFSPQSGSLVGAPPTLNPKYPTNNGEGMEWALRLYQEVSVGGKSTEWALYGYRGFFKSPQAVNLNTGRPYFPELVVFGASLRRPLFKGIANLEFAHHYSKEDSRGVDPLIPNSQNRFLLGYEQELVSRLTLGAQYYQERIQNFDQQLANSFNPQYELGPRRHVITTRLTYRARNDKVNLSLFMFVSSDEDDRYLRPSVNWRVNDEVRFDLGGNYFGGERKTSFLGQFSENSNLYVRARIVF